MKGVQDHTRALICEEDVFFSFVKKCTYLVVCLMVPLVHLKNVSVNTSHISTYVMPRIQYYSRKKCNDTSRDEYYALQPLELSGYFRHEGRPT